MKHKTMYWNAPNSYQAIQEFEPQSYRMVVEVSANFRQRNNPKIQQITYFAENGDSLAVRVAGGISANSLTYKNLCKIWNYDTASDGNGLEWQYFKRCQDE